MKNPAWRGCGMLLLALIPWIGVMVILIWLTTLRFPFSGVFHVSTSYEQMNPWIQPFLPAERVTMAGAQPDGWSGQRIFNDPVYFTALIPGPYETVDVSLEYRPLRQPLLELGLVRDAQGRQLELQPLFSSELERSDWIQIVGSEQEGYVRKGFPATSLRAATSERLALWNGSSTMPLLKDTVAKKQEVALSLRGSHDFYLVPTEEGIFLRLALQAANRQEGSDRVVVRVFRGSDEILQQVVPLSGSKDKGMGPLVSHTVHLPAATPGVYRIAVGCSDEVFIRMFETNNPRWVIGPRLYLGDIVGFATSTRPLSIVTGSHHLLFETLHSEGFQTLRVGTSTLSLARTHTPMRFDRGDSLKEPMSIYLPRGDVRIVGDGFFTQNQDAYFEPKPRKFQDETLLDVEGIDAVLTSYHRPTPLSDGWYRSTLRFPLSSAQEYLRFVLSAPGLMSRAGAVDVRRMDLVYRRPPLTLTNWVSLWKQELRFIWARISSQL